MAVVHLHRFQSIACLLANFCKIETVQHLQNCMHLPFMEAHVPNSLTYSPCLLHTTYSHMVPVGSSSAQQARAKCMSRGTQSEGDMSGANLHVPILLRGFARHVHQPYPQYMHHVEGLPSQYDADTGKG